jgi:hypothetical protein
MDNHFHVLWDGGHIKFFSVKTLTALLKTEGFTDLHFNFAGRFPYLWKSMLCSCYPIDQKLNAVSVIILTRDEQVNLPDCLASVEKWVQKFLWLILEVAIAQ